MRNRLLIALTLVLTALLAIAGTAMAEDTYIEGDWELRTLEDGTKEVVKFLNKGATEAVIPDGVTSIGHHAFAFNTFLTSVTIPEGVTNIEWCAFFNCTSLTNITLPAGVTSIGHAAFEDCTSLTSITLPDSITSIGEEAFERCTSLTSVIIPESLTSLDKTVFPRNAEFTVLTNIYTEGDWKLRPLEDGTKEVVKFLNKKATEVVFPEGVTRIGDHAFQSCNSLASITIPEGVTSIGELAFSFSSLTSITIPDSVTSIGENAFSDCSSLTSIMIPDSVTSIGGRAFEGCTSLAGVIVTPGSYAEQYAKDNNLPYAYAVAYEDSIRLFGDWQSIPSSEDEPAFYITFKQDGNRAIIMASRDDNEDQYIDMSFQMAQGKLFFTNKETGETTVQTYQLGQDGQSLALTEYGYTINFVRTTFEPSLDERLQANKENASRRVIPNIGDIITFGAYPQTAEGTDNTPIEWQVLDQDGDNLLLISRYGLDMQPYSGE